MIQEAKNPGILLAAINGFKLKYDDEDEDFKNDDNSESEEEE